MLARILTVPGAMTLGKVVAFGRGFGDSLSQLACPAGIQIGTTSGALYIADEANDRVMRWSPGSDAGVVVAGGCGPGEGTHQFYHPLGLWVSPDESFLLVADSLNYRIQRWSLGSASKEHLPITLAGGSRGAGPGQLGQPMECFLDGSGALFVSDSDHGRVQRYPAEEIASHTAAFGVVERPVQKRERVRGRCVEYKHSGYGFVKDDAGLKYFVHHSDIRVSSEEGPLMNGYPFLVKGQEVTFEPRSDAKWRQRCSVVVKLT